MSISKDRWFEVWFDQGEDAIPAWILIVTPDKTNPGLVIVSDPQESYRVIHEGQDYDTTCLWLQEDEYCLVNGRVFPDDGLPLATKKRE